jgi:hypothetical protein
VEAASFFKDSSATSNSDSLDSVEGLVIQGGTSVEVLNGISLHGGLVVSWPQPVITANFVVEA